MACSTFKWGDSTGVICGRGRSKPKKCWVVHCPDPATRLCDWPLGEGKTCDRPLCDRHSERLGPDKDYCPIHSIEHVKAQLKDGR